MKVYILAVIIAAFPAFSNAAGIPANTPNSFYNTILGVTQCNPLLSYYDGVCQIQTNNPAHATPCPTGGFWDDGLGSCTCYPGLSWYQGECQPQRNNPAHATSCPANGIWNDAYQKCTCLPGYDWNSSGSYCAPQSCNNGWLSDLFQECLPGNVVTYYAGEIPPPLPVPPPPPPYPVGTCNSGAGEYWNSQYQTCVGYNGVEQTGNGYPDSLVYNFWNHCNEFSCDGANFELWVTPGDGDPYYCDGGLGDTLYVVGMVTGNYSGWTDRNNFIDTALSTQGGSAGSWHFPGEWYMPSSIWMRNYQDGGWMNMNIHSICTTSAALEAGDVTEGLESLDWLGILAIFFIGG